jgi:hypothetical protein
LLSGPALIVHSFTASRKYKENKMIKKIFRLVRNLLPFHLLIFSLFVDSASASSWFIETIDNINPGTATISLTLDLNGKTHIGYYNSSNESLKYATNVSGAWVISTVQSGSVDQAGISIATDSGGKAHICYQNNGDLVYATNSSGIWVKTIVDAGAWPGDSAIAVDSNGKIHISYFYLTNFDLKYATNSSGTWQKSIIVNGGAIGPLPSYATAIALDKNGKVHINYYDDASPDSVKYITNASGAWQITTIDTIGLAAGWQLSIAVDQNCAVHMIYYNWTNDELKYATNVSGSWVKTTVSKTGDSNVFQMALALDNSGKVHISYEAGNGLKYATNMTGTWQSVTVESWGTQGCNSIALSPDQKVHIGYYDYVGSANGYAVKHAYQPPPIISNSIGSRNSIKITDMSGSLSTSGATITVTAWDINGNAIPESTSAAALTLHNNGTTTILGTDLAARFPTGTPILYALSADSSKYIITNVKISSDGTLNVPNGYTSGTTKFVANSVGARNSIKITDMSGSLSFSGAAIAVAVWDVSGNAISESTSAAALKLYNNGTTTIAGTDLMARFPTGAPMSYEFTVGSSKYVITNVKSSADGTINIPYAYTSGTTNFVANSIGSRNTIKITDVSGSLSAAGAAITITAWDVNGNAIPESTTAAALKLFSRGTTSITGTNLTARFPSGTPMSYEFAVSSSKYIITNIKSSIDGTINIPAVYTSGTITYASNNISSHSTIKISDASGSLSSSGGTITIQAWDVYGNAVPESTSAAQLKLYSNGTTTIPGTTLAARFPTGTPVLYEFTVGSSKYLITNVTSSADGTVTVPNVYSSGVAGGI